MPDAGTFLSLIATALGRLLIGGYFVAAGLRALWLRKRIAPALAARGMPAAAAFVIGAGVLQAAAGAALALGLLVALPALALGALVLGTSLWLLDFRSLPQGPEREVAQGLALAHVAVIGGLLLAAAG